MNARRGGIALLVVALIGGVSACATTGEPTAAPTTAAPTSAYVPTSAIPSPTRTVQSAGTPSPTTTRTAAPEPHVIGPFGFGALRLGMTKVQAEATGLTRGVDPSVKAACGMDGKDGLLRYVRSMDNDSLTGWLVFSAGTGRLVAIYAYLGIKTPEGIGLGSSYAELHRAYPSWQGIGGDTNGRGGVVVPGNPKAHYRIDVANHKVLQLSLDSNDQDCYE